MKKITCLFALLGALVFTEACQRLSESRKTGNEVVSVSVGSFDKIRVQAACNLSFEVSDSVSVTLSGDTVLVDAISIEKQDGWLVFKEKRPSVNPPGILEIKVTAPALSGLEMMGAGDVVIRGEVKADSMALMMNGAGSIVADRIFCQQLSANVNGAGSVKLKSVTADDISLRLDGVGSLDAAFSASGSLDCALAGVGSAHLEGDVKSFSKHSSGVGHIDADKLKVGK